MTTNNEAFEELVNSLGYSTDKYKYMESDSYANGKVDFGWMIWQAATTEANKRIKELEVQLQNWKDFSKKVQKIDFNDYLQLQASNNHLREALENVLSWVVYQPVACHGMKCRESVCESCCGEEAAEIASKQAGEAVTIARKALSATPAESLQAHDGELLERAAKEFDKHEDEAWIARKIRALKTEVTK